MKKILFLILIAVIMLSFSIPAYSAPNDEVTEGTLKIAGEKMVCPLEHTEVDARLSGFIGRVNVTQTFKNPLNKPIEAVYIFPLPANAAVDAMVMKIGNREIRAKIEQRDKAKKIYEQAKSSGQRAALLEQERPNIFTQSVANIMPGDKIEINISYVQELKYSDGEYEFVFPMVVGPRYIPGSSPSYNVDTPSEIQPVRKEEKVKLEKEQSGTGWAVDTDRVPDASRITPIVMPPGRRAGHDIGIKVTIESPFALEKISSVLHKIDVAKTKNAEPPYKAIVTLKKEDNIPNKDFILKYTVAGNKIAEGLVYHMSPKNGGFFSLVLQPPQRPSDNEITPKEMIFVIDSSGSQSGWPLAKAVETMKHCIDNMNSDDTFNLFDFSNQTIKVFDKPVANNETNRQKAKDFLSSKIGGGGTEMLPAVLEALQLKEDPKRLRIVCFMTDGYVGNDMEIISSIKKNLGNARLFSFGTGNSVNRYLIDKMAEAGRGEAEIVTLNRDGEEVADAFQKKIGTPLMTDISVDWGNLGVTEVFPNNHPDLFSGKPLIFTGRYSKASSGDITVKGFIAKKPFSKKIKADFPSVNKENDVLSSLWARKKIESIMDTDLERIQRGEPSDEAKKDITDLGLAYNLVTQFTSFVAVEDKVVNKDGKTVTVPVPVEIPDGVSYEGIFGSEKKDYGMPVPASPAPSYKSMTSGVNSEAYSPSAQRTSAPVGKSKVQSRMVYDNYGESEVTVSPESKLDDVLGKIITGKISSKESKSIGLKDQIGLYIKTTHISPKLIKKLKDNGLNLVSYSAGEKVVTGYASKNSILKIASISSVVSIEYFNLNASAALIYKQLPAEKQLSYDKAPSPEKTLAHFSLWGYLTSKINDFFVKITKS